MESPGSQSLFRESCAKHPGYGQMVCQRNHQTTKKTALMANPIMIRRNKLQLLDISQGVDSYFVMYLLLQPCLMLS
jgi:hypothetical protein